MSEYSLRGGSVSTVVRVGDTVRRQPGRRLVRELPGFLERSVRAEAGDPAMVRLRDEGAVREVRASFGWVAAHRSELEVS